MHEMLLTIFSNIELYSEDCMIEQSLRFSREVLDIFFTVSLKSVFDLIAKLQDGHNLQFLKSCYASLQHYCFFRHKLANVDLYVFHKSIEKVILFLLNRC
ncbi:hypothetical protein HZS_3391 [Henneguya salminicola]|nr:hypothetical protein HZS_3391 [Henneguya salminicola]